MVQSVSPNTFGVAKWVVSPDATQGTHTTIAGALASASSGDTIFIRDGTYTENPTLVAGVNLAALNCDALTPNVTILGKCSFSGSGTVSISGINLQTNSDYAISVTGSAASTLNLTYCMLTCSNHTGIQYTSSNAASQISVDYSSALITNTGITLFSHSAAGVIYFYYFGTNNTGSSTTASTCSSGNVGIQFSVFSIPITISGTGGFDISHTIFQLYSLNVTAFTHGGSSGNNTIRHCDLECGSATALVINTGANVKNSQFFSTNIAAISGSGTINYTGLTFASSSNITTTTQTVLACGPVLSIGGAAQILSGAGSPSGSVTAPQGSLYLRTNGSGTSNRAYINTNGSTGWTAIQTAS